MNTHITPPPTRQISLFFNTTDLPDEEVKKKAFRAKSQNNDVLQYFIKYPQAKFTPIQVYTALNIAAQGTGKTILLQSIRRAITCLTQMELLHKFRHVKRKELYGDSNCTWALNPDYKKVLAKMEGDGV
jgi:Fe2+ or Zn2+ uptake regulation protein